MGVIMNILQNHKATQRERAASLNVYAQKIGAIDLVGVFDQKIVKGFLDGRTEPKIIQLLSAEAEHVKQSTINWLLKKGPLDYLNEEIQELEEKIIAWADKVKGDPAYYLSWGEQMFMTAGAIKVLKNIYLHLDGKKDQWDNPDYWKKTKEIIKDAALDKASGGTSSSSSTSNLMMKMEAVAWVNAARNFLNPIWKIEHWFEKKNELGLKINEE